MGDIGSGKSTIAKLIVGLKRYESGDILINGVSLKTLNINKLRNLLPIFHNILSYLIEHYMII